MSKPPKPAADPGYAAASAELEQILRDMETGEIDLDVLTDKVERAASLLQYCRQKLASTETKVQKVTADLAAAAEGKPKAGDEEAEA
jgi:exodeoxyribonuclease VII small subunit